MSEPKPRAPRTRKKIETTDTEPLEVIDTAEAEQAAETEGMRPVEDAPADLPAETDTEKVDDEDRPVLLASSLVRGNEYARNSQSVRAVQDALRDAGYWDVRADPAGYWGSYTQDAAASATGEADPVAAARALGFTVI